MCTEDENPSFNKIFSVLENKGIVIMPCDTIYGFVGIYPETEKTIQQLKGRNNSKPLLILIRKEWISRYTTFQIDEYFLNLWPGPLTLIVPDKNQSTVAIRVPEDKRLLSLLSKLNNPLFSTSVNRSGKPAMYLSEEISAEFANSIDLFVNEGDLLGRVSSTIIDMSKKPYKIIRQGNCRIDLDKLL